MYWWWVVQSWVEGGSTRRRPPMLIKTTGVEREVVDSKIYVIIGRPALFTGILGTAHHYTLLHRPAGLLATGTFAWSRSRLLPMTMFALRCSAAGRDHANQAAGQQPGCAWASSAGVEACTRLLFVIHITGTQISRIATHGPGQAYVQW